MTKKSVCFIINPASGTKRLENIEDIIKSEFAGTDYDFDIKYTESAGHACLLAKESVEKHTTIIAAVGGDGTVNEIAAQMIGSECTLAIIPVGSGNGLARHLGIPLSVAKALRLIRNGQITKIDTALINNKKFISIAGIGFDALVAQIFSGNKNRGFFSYFSIVATQFSKYREKKYHLEFDNGEVITTRAFFIAFANSNQFGYNTVIAPNAKLNDGLLDVCIVRKPKFLDFPMIVNLLLLKKIDQSSFVKIIPAKNIIIKQSKSRYVNIDGEAIKMKKKFKVEINPNSINVIIPE